MAHNPYAMWPQVRTGGWFGSVAPRVSTSRVVLMEVPFLLSSVNSRVR